MREIRLLDKETTDKIAAGEVVERPSSVVKELIENSIDAGASAVSVEIRNGGTSLIRVTDNGCGIPKDQVEKAFMRHSTSKIGSASDLLNIRTLGFRGEALSSICAVSRLELCTKTHESIMGSVYKVEGSAASAPEDAGLPDGTTVIVRDLFYNVPARLKFLKSPATEAGYVSGVVEKIALSHPDVSVKFISNGSVRLLTSGNGSLRDAVFAVYGRRISDNLIEVDSSGDCLKLSGFIGKPEIARSARTLENFFLNGRYVKDKTAACALEDAFKGYQMKGTFPFACLNITMDPELVDVNVHPSKLEVKFFDSERVYDAVFGILSEIISGRENIPSFSVSPGPAAERKSAAARENRPRMPKEDNQSSPDASLSGPGGKEPKRSEESPDSWPEPFERVRLSDESLLNDKRNSYASSGEEDFVQTTLSDNAFISEKARPGIRIAGEVFDTYWICEYDDKMYIIDQHAAHEKVLYEKIMGNIRSNEVMSQRITPPLIVSLSASEEAVLRKYIKFFNAMGFEAEHFGGTEYAISAVPATLYSSIDDETLFFDMINELSKPGRSDLPEVLLDRAAAAACKAAVKGNSRLSLAEAQELINSLMELENPYNCPHGRPTIITMSKYELEKKFKRII